MPKNLICSKSTLVQGMDWCSQATSHWLNLSLLRFGITRPCWVTSSLLSTRKFDTLQWRHNEHDSVSNHRYPIVCSTVCSGADQRKHQSSESLAFVRGIHWRPVDSPHKEPVMWKMFSFDNVIMRCLASSTTKMPNEFEGHWETLNSYFPASSLHKIWWQNIHPLNLSPLWHNGRHFTDYIFRCILEN